MELAGLLARSGATLSIKQREGLMSVLDGSGAETRPVVFIDEDKGQGGDVAELAAGLMLADLLAFCRLLLRSGDADGPAMDPRSLPFLERALADGLRFGVRPETLKEVAQAAAVALQRQSDSEPDAGALRDRLRDMDADTALRRAGVQIISATLAQMSPIRRKEVLEGLRAYWRSEREPEMKLALAMAIVQSSAAPR